MSVTQKSASITGCNEKTVRTYRNEFYENKGKFKETKQGRCQRRCLLNDEDLRLDAAMFIRENAYKKGAANLTAKAFYHLVNTDLPSHTLPLLEVFLSEQLRVGCINLVFAHSNTKRVHTWMATSEMMWLNIVWNICRK